MALCPSVVPVWKKIGQSTHALALSLAQKYGVPAAHTGILDPMAEGVVVVLLGEERFLKTHYSQGRKVYLVEVLVGLSTDTHDLLGVVNKVDLKPLSPISFDVVLSNVVGEINQIPPSFSAVRVAGKRLLDHVRAGDIEKISVGERKVRVFETTTLGQETVSLKNLQSRLENFIPLVEGDFRQDLILKRWQDLLSELPPQFTLIRFAVVSGPGFYVRALVRDLSRQLGVPLLVYSLVREENGGYQRNECVKLEI